MRFRVLMVLVVICILLMGACSRSSNDILSLDANNQTNAIQPYSQLPPESLNSNHNLLGFWWVTIDSNNLTWTAKPVREATGHLNVLSWLEVSPCTNCFSITKIEQTPEKNLYVDVAIKHPYSTPNLTGFDVRGIAMFGGDEFFNEFGLRISSLMEGNPTLANADGHTTLYNPTTAGNGFSGYIKGKYAPTFATPTATLNGYKAYYSNPNRRYFSAGATLVNTYYIVKPPSLKTFTFGYAVDASWAKPTQPVTVPDSFPLTANCAEAYKIDAHLSNPLASTEGSKTTLTIDVYDWQGASTIGAVAVEAPYFWSGLKNATPTSGGPGTKRFTCQLVNEFGFVDSGEYPIVIRVLDTSSSPGALIDNIGWKVFLVPVIINHPPVCSASVSNYDPNIGESVTFKDTSTDLEGPSDLDESWWDWDNDGTWDEQGFEVNHSWSSAGVYKINHMVKDKAGAIDTLDSPIEIDVGLYITISEDLASKKIGTTYQYISMDKSYTNGTIINVEDTDGPWDFTTIGLSSLANTVKILSDTDSEVAGFVNNFNAATTHFVKSTNMYDPFFPTLYQAEYHYVVGNLLYIYGFHDPFLIGSSPFGPPHTAEYLVIPFPLTTATNYSFDINNPGFVLTYQVKTLGEGDVKVPYGGGKTYRCLLVRYKFNVSAADPLNGGTLNFAFISDSGIVVANVIAVNDPPIYNWNTSTNKINPSGMTLFQALNNIN